MLIADVSNKQDKKAGECMLDIIEIDGKTYQDGNEIKWIKKNYLICGFTYSIQFYGYNLKEQPIFKHFLKVRIFWKMFAWTFRTLEYWYPDNPHTCNFWKY